MDAEKHRFILQNQRNRRLSASKKFLKLLPIKSANIREDWRGLADNKSFCISFTQEENN